MSIFCIALATKYNAAPYSISSLSHEMRNSQKRRISIIVVDALGIANRLRILYGVYSLCSQHESKLIVIWIPSPECSATYSDIFQYHCHSNLSILELNQGGISNFNDLLRRDVFSIAASFQIPVFESFPSRFLIGNNLFGDDADGVWLVWTRGSHVAEQVSCQQSIISKSRFYNGFRLISSIDNIVENVIQTHFSSHNPMIGVHIRAFDESHDWAVVAPDAAATTQRSLRFDEASPLSAFIFLLENMFRYNPNLTIFLASNSASAKSFVVNKFPMGKIVALADNFNRSHKEGIFSALVDFFLLAQSDVVIHSRGSSFAREAAAVRRIPVIDVKKLITVVSFI